VLADKVTALVVTYCWNRQGKAPDAVMPALSLCSVMIRYNRPHMFIYTQVSVVTECLGNALAA
jgi:hypothetical protein